MVLGTVDPGVTSTHAPVAEGSEEEERQVKGLFESLGRLCNGIDDIVVCKAVAVFMGTMLVQSQDWRRAIPGFLNHITQVGNMALLHHQEESKNAKEGEDPGQASADSTGSAKAES